MPDTLIYRRFQEEDLPGILALWEASGWGTLDAETWRSWFQTAAIGPALITVAHDGETIRGQMVFAPAEIDGPEGTTYRALRLSAPILDESVRSHSARSIQHPAVRLFFAGLDAAKEDGYDVIYAQPERAWLAFFRWGVTAERFTTSEFGCVALDLDGGPRAPEGWTAQRADAPTEDYRALWDAARDAFPVAYGIQRTVRRLRYRLGSHEVIEAWADGSLRGYVAIRPSDGLIMDAMAATPEDLARTFATVAGVLAYQPDLPFGALKAMRTPAWRGALEAAGFEDDPYAFLLAICPVSERTSNGVADPEAWYATPAD